MLPSFNSTKLIPSHFVHDKVTFSNWVLPLKIGFKSLESVSFYPFSEKSIFLSVVILGDVIIIFKVHVFQLGFVMGDQGCGILWRTWQNEQFRASSGL